MSPAIKLEGDELMDDFPLFPGFLDPEPNYNVQDEFVLGNDSMSLKGQVWPGMGKMDLADDITRRARNQKKPKSVIDKMEKASERIEPTQVIMSSKFEVERTKDVYDDTSSPAPGQEESVCAIKHRILHADSIRHHPERSRSRSERNRHLLQKYLETFRNSGEEMPVDKSLPLERGWASRKNRNFRKSLKYTFHQKKPERSKTYSATMLLEQAGLSWRKSDSC